MTAYYNEYDKYAAQWLRNLIAAGHIAPGDVDERSIEDVCQTDLVGYTQCHFFAGIGVWSYALRRAGWPDDRPIWTGSCPCQPFSAAGEGAGFADERHLWPAFQHLIRECNPAVVAGEQVASGHADPWIDLVHTDLEALGYAFGALAFPSAGVGAPHIRDRLYWMGHADHARLEGHAGHGGPAGWQGPRGPVAAAGIPVRLADAAGIRQHGRRAGEASNGGNAPRLEPERLRNAGIDGRTGPTNGFWRDADWLACRDGKWRPVEASPQPLVDGSAESLGRVRAEIVAEVEGEINAATAQTEGGRAEAMRNLLEDLGAKAKCGWAAGRLPRLHEAPFLLAFLRQLQEQGWHIAEGVALPRAEATSGMLRSVWHQQATAGAPCGRGLGEQQPGEPADPVCFLSRILARHAQEAWGDAYAAYAEIGFPIGYDAAARVGRLRAYGNAINAEAAVAFIQAMMESLP